MATKKTKTTAQGVGESRVFAAPEAARDDAGWTVNGKPVPPEFAHVIPYEATDQGIAEKNARPNVREDAGRVKVTRGEMENFLEARAAQPWDDPRDALKAFADSHVRPGFRPRLLSERTIAVKGLRGFEPVIVNGDPVKFGNLMLGEMPADVAERRNEYFRGQANDALAKSAEEIHEKQDELFSEARRRGFEVRPLTPGEHVQDTQHPGRVAEIGLRRTRGNLA